MIDNITQQRRHGAWLQSLILATALLLSACGGSNGDNAGAEPDMFGVETMGLESTRLDPHQWTEGAVRRVLHTFAFGGQASDAQIRAWAEMAPERAIGEILTFSPSNPKLSPVEDQATATGSSLGELQTLWSSDAPGNPLRPSLRSRHAYYTIAPQGGSYVSRWTLSNTWVESINKRGLNPFRAKVGLFLTNYYMATSLENVSPPLLLDLYDQLLLALQQDQALENIIALAASSPAVAQHFGHQYSSYDNATGQFKGNDDFARELHQLYFRITGEREDPDYHENVTIEHTALALTGLAIDQDPSAYRSDVGEGECRVSPINFSDHIDGRGREILNVSRHFAGELEILGATISGANAQEKLNALSQVALRHQESLDNLPVYIVQHFADDNLNADKIDEIRALWAATEPKSLLRFLRAYAVSTTFHRPDTYKFRTSIDRNLTVYNLNTVNNVEAYTRHPFQFESLRKEGIRVFYPDHGVFGHQDGVEAAKNPGVFRAAYSRAVNEPWWIARPSETYTEATGTQRWEKDWARLIPTDAQGRYPVDQVARWLWQRFIADDLRNYSVLERAHLSSILALERDFGALADPGDPTRGFDLDELQSPELQAIIRDNEGQFLALNSADDHEREKANRRVGLAVNFIAMTPYAFVITGP